LKVPNMGNGSGKLNMAQTFPTHFSTGNLYAAAVTNYSLIPNPFIFTAMALPVFGRAEDPLAEQAVTFRLQSTVIDSFRFFHFTMGTGFDRFRRRQSDTHTIKIADVQQLYQLP